MRLHRAGEREPYTGIKPAGTQIDSAVAAADPALLKGQADPLVRLITERVAAGIRQRFERAEQVRASADIDVGAGREYIEPYVVPNTLFGAVGPGRPRKRNG